MRIAVATKGLLVSQSFKQTESFICYNVVNGVVVDCQNLPYLGQPYEELLKLFKELDVQTLIVGRINVDVADFFCTNDVCVVAGTEGETKIVVDQYLTNELIGTEDCCDL